MIIERKGNLIKINDTHLVASKINMFKYKDENLVINDNTTFQDITKDDFKSFLEYYKNIMSNNSSIISDSGLGS